VRPRHEKGKRNVDLEKAEATGDPVGSYAALIDHNLNPKRFGSCSAPSGANKGCSSFHHCRYLNYRDGINAPGNVAVLSITPQNAAAVNIKSCFDYYRSGDDGKRRNGDKNGWVIQIVGYEGDTVKDRGSRRAHRKKNADCPACQSGSCNKMDQYEEDRIVPAFERLGDENKGSIKSDFAVRMRKLALSNLETEKTQIALNNQVPAKSPAEVPGHEGPGTPRLNR
jgi:hypothetical protein